MSTGPGTIDYRALLKRAHEALDEMQARLDRAERARHEPIAIVGLGLRFPGGAVDVESFWRVLHDGVDVVTEVPRERWDVDAYYDADPDAPGKAYTRWGAFLDGIDRFDPHFFGISPREAAAMDPQQRLLLEVAWEALENAGHAGAALAGTRAGVFVGMAGSDFSVLPRGDLALADTYFATGAARSIAAGRIAYTLGLHGPALAVDTACSSSAVATHLACQSLRIGDTDLALAGGVNVMLAPDGSITTSRGRMMSFTGRCRTFDAAADGYVRAEGCAILVLKRLADAERDGDHVHAVILGTAVNQDGRSNGITAPNAQAQEAVIRAALADAGLDPSAVGLLEAHGTGTTLGDPIEMRAIGAVFAPGRTPDDPLRVGSVKTNIGHTEGVAGTAGLVKLVLALQQRTVPPHLHLSEPNPLIPWDTLPVTVPVAPTAWSIAGGQRRIAGVSSFGFSGTNSHIVLAEPAPHPGPAPHESEAERPHAVVLSARTAPALHELAARWEQRLAGKPRPALADVAWTANTGRTHFSERLAVVAASTAQAAERLAAWRAGGPMEGVVCGGTGDGEPPEIAFLFTGQGAQYVGMARRLAQAEPVFRDALRRCDDLLRPHLDRPLLDVIHPSAGAEADAERRIGRTAYTQPALFAVEYALARLWMEWGVEPALVMGHSVGEYVAACVAGVFSLEDGLRLIAARGRLMDALPEGGAMAAVFADEPTVAAAIEGLTDRLAIAAVNGPANVVVSGDADALREVLARLAADGLQSRPLRVSHAFHSPRMDSMLDEWQRIVDSVQLREPEFGVVSNLTGSLAGAELTDAGYWRRHVREPVRFADGVRTLHDQGCRAFVEVGPAPTLLGMAQACLPDANALWLPSLRRDRDDPEQLLESLATLHVHGAAVDWAAVGAHAPRRRVPLPTYPFQRTRHWMQFPEPGRPRPGERLHPLVHERIRSPLIAGAAFRSRLGVAAPDYLDDHRIYGLPLFPATGFVEIAIAAAQMAGHHGASIAELRILEPLPLPESGEAELQVAVDPAGDGTARLRIFGLPAGAPTGSAATATVDGADEPARWTLHAEGVLAGGSATPLGRLEPTKLAAELPDTFEVDGFYGRLAELGVDYGPAFACLREIRRRDGEALGRVELPDSVLADAVRHSLHPGLLDACVQLVGAALPGADPDAVDAPVYVPVELSDVRVVRSGASAGWCRVRILETEAAAAAERITAELRLVDDRGEPVAGIGKITLQRAPRAAIERLRADVSASESLSDSLFRIGWEEVGASTPHAGSAAGRWLVLADEGGVGDAVARRLREAGAEADPLRSDALDPLDPADWEAHLRAGEGALPLRGIVHLWGLDAPRGRTADTLLEHQRRACGAVPALLRGLVAAGGADGGRSSGGTDAADGIRLLLATRGAHAVEPGDAVAPEQAPLWALAGVVTLEHPELGVRCVDLDPAAGPDDAAMVVAELVATDTEDRTAWRAGRRHAERILRWTPPAALGHGTGASSESATPGAAADGACVEVVTAGGGTLDELGLTSCARRAPAPGEVEIDVRASGLNFRDVLNALGMYPGDAGPLGSECAGVVSAVGEGVTSVQLGDEVIALAAGTFRSHAIAAASSVHPKPAGWSWQQAAGMPLVFLTAYHGLHELAGVRRGDRVLVHAAAGGVGLAAVQLALRAGAEVFATAGSDAKREFLRSRGVHHVFDSRSLEFADQVRAATGGDGVQVVLNALADEFIPTSLALLAKGGCFLEIGKRGIWSAERVAAEYPEVCYHAYDLADVIRHDPGWFGRAMDALVPAFDAGALTPLPTTAFPLARAADAFRFMAQARHTGKIVLTRLDAGDAATTVRGDSSYLVTGGLGGLGLIVGQWLAERGAGAVVLLGRSAPDDAAREAIGRMEAAGARVTVLSADVASEADVERSLATIAETLPPLRGVVHAAGVLDDGMLAQQNWPRIAAVMRPKLQGGWNLHRAALRLELDFFLLFSAGAALVGSAGQGGYAAANAFLDGLAAHRRALGLPATSMAWGAWAEAGMAARLDPQERQRWSEHGIATIATEDGLRVLDLVLASRPAYVAPLPIRWRQFLARLGPAGQRPFFTRLAPSQAGAPQEARDADAASSSEAGGLRDALLAMPADRRIEHLRGHVERGVRRVLALEPDVAIGAGTGFTDLGMDSLMAVELGNHLSTLVGRKLPSTIAFENPTLPLLTDYLAREVLQLAEADTDQAADRRDATADGEAERIARVADLSDDEVQDTLLKELERAGY